MQRESNTHFMHTYKTAFLMAAIPGFTDVMSFIGMNRLFTAHITGNIVIAIADTLHHDNGNLAKIIALITFFIGATLLSFLLEIQGKTQRLLFFLFSLETFFLFTFMIAGIYVNQLSHPLFNTWAYIGAGLLGVFAMTIHNLLSKTFFTHLPPCTAMTGNFTQIIIDTVKHIHTIVRKKNKSNTDKKNENLKKSGNALFAFLIGGICAALSYHFMGFSGTIIVVVTQAILTYQIFHGTIELKNS